MLKVKDKTLKVIDSKVVYVIPKVKHSTLKVIIIAENFSQVRYSYHCQILQ